MSDFKSSPHQTPESVTFGDASSDAHSLTGSSTFHGRLSSSYGATFVGDVTAGSISISGSLSCAGDDISFDSATSAKPLIEIKNTTNDANPAVIRFVKNRTTDSAADYDQAGKIDFYADNDAEQQTHVASIQTFIRDVSDGAEQGQIRFSVAEYDGTMTSGLELRGDSTDGTIDATIGAAVNSYVNATGDFAAGATLSGSGGISGQSLTVQQNITGAAGIQGQTLNIQAGATITGSTTHHGTLTSTTNIIAQTTLSGAGSISGQSLLIEDTIKQNNTTYGGVTRYTAAKTNLTLPKPNNTTAWVDTTLEIPANSALRYMFIQKTTPGVNSNGTLHVANIGARFGGVEPSGMQYEAYFGDWDVPGGSSGENGFNLEGAAGAPDYTGHKVIHFPVDGHSQQAVYDFARDLWIKVQAVGDASGGTAPVVSLFVAYDTYDLS